MSASSVGSISYTIITGSYDRIGPAAAALIIAELEQNSTLTSLDLWRDDFGADDATALAGTFIANSTLTSLGLENDRLEADQATTTAPVARLIERNRHILEQRTLSLQAHCFKVLSRTVVESYFQEDQSRVHYQIWMHSGQPEELGFGRNNVFRVTWQIFLRSVRDARLDLGAGMEQLLTEQVSDVSASLLESTWKYRQQLFTITP